MYLCLSVSCLSCDSRDQSPPGSSGSAPEVVVRSEDSYLGLSAGTSGDSLYASSEDFKHLFVWRWHDGLPKKVAGCDIPESLPAVFAGDGMCVFQPITGESFRVIMQEAGTNRTLMEVPLDEGWYCRVMRASRNGRFVGLSLGEDVPHTDHAQVRLGLVSVADAKVSWFPTLVSPDDVGGSIWFLVPSDDGKYLAAVWRGEVVLADMGSGTVAWQVAPKEEAGTADVAFSPDGKTLYCGGTRGCVYVMETATGKVLRRWFASDSGASEYGHGIEHLAVSPDGRFVAAGTVPKGKVYLCDTQKDDKITILETKGYVFALTFSPDSASLAAVTDRTIRVWNIK